MSPAFDVFVAAASIALDDVVDAAFYVAAAVTVPTPAVLLPLLLRLFSGKRGPLPVFEFPLLFPLEGLERVHVQEVQVREIPFHLRIPSLLLSFKK